MPGTIVDFKRPAATQARALRLARGLGWFSIGLGTMELLMPGALARLLGLRGQENLVRSYGLREIGTGIGILRSQDPTGWIWGRVGGDVLDIATVAIGLRGPRRGNAVLALVSLAGVTAVDAVVGGLLSSKTDLPPLRWPIQRAS